MSGEPAKKDGAPHFLPGAFANSTCMIVDQNGVAWWVQPELMVIKRVEWTPPSAPTTPE